MKLIRKYKPILSYALGRNPRVQTRKKDNKSIIPKGYQSVVCISADFELGWAWRYAKIDSDGKLALQFAERERKHVPEIIRMCKQYNIPITWGTVGHLFLESCPKKNGIKHPGRKRPAYFENEWWHYIQGDWYDHDPCSSWQEAPLWYAPDLIQQIQQSQVAHELACHTFSHIDCSDTNSNQELLLDEITACKEAAEPYGVNLKSFIFPGHTMGHFNLLKKQGFSSVRTNYTNILGYPEKDSTGLWLHPVTLEIKYNPLWSQKFNLKRYIKLLQKALKRKQYCHFWFHPSFDTCSLELLEYIMAFLHQEKSLCVTTMEKYSEFLETGKWK